MKICVYCASSSRAPVKFGNAAYELGQIFAANGIKVVYGGGAVGSMGRLADGVISGNGEIAGIMPRFMKELEWAHPEVPNLLLTNDMAERKARLIEDSDAVVALPGGCGTFEELLETITLKRLGIYLKPIVILNQEGFYDPLIELFERSIQNQFMDERHLQMFSVVSDVSQILEAISSAIPWDKDSRDFAALK